MAVDKQRSIFGGRDVRPGAVSAEGGFTGQETRLPVQAGVNAQDLARCSTAEARRLVSYEQASRFNVLPLGTMHLAGREIVTFASCEGLDPDTWTALKFLTGRDIKIMPVISTSLQASIFAAYHGDDAALREKILEVSERHESPAMRPRGFGPNVVEFRPKSGEAAVLLAALIDYAISHNASDLHILPRLEGAFLRLRIDGALRDHSEAFCPPSLHGQLVNRIKVLCSLDITRKDLPQDGSFNIPAGGRTVHIRTSLMPTVHGEKAVLRLHTSQQIPALDSLGLDPGTLSSLELFMQRKQGAILFAGATGSGKSTTMYAVVEKFNARHLNCVSLEDPVEIIIPGVSQTSLNPAAGLDYADCLRSVLRQDPDVILLGEIRDEQSAKIALQAAITGHVLLSSVHARNAMEALLRLKNLGIDDLTMAQAVSMIVCQKLVPALCENCRVIDLPASNKAHCDIYRDVGCARCDYSGFSGRVLVSHSLFMAGELTKALSAGDWDRLLRTDTVRSEASELLFSLERLLKAGRIGLKEFVAAGGAG